MKEQGIVWPSILDQPVHRAENVLLCRLTHGILLVVCQDDHVLPLVSKILRQVCCHVADVVDAPTKLPALAKVVDSDQ